MLYQRKIANSEVLAARLDLQLQNGGYASIGAHLAGVAVMAGLLWFQLPRQWIFAWVGGMLSLLLLSLFRMTQALRGDWANKRPVMVYNEMILSALVIGAAWAGTVFWLDGLLSDQWLYMVVLIVVFIAIVAISVMVIIRELYLVYMFSMMVPVAAWLVFHVDSRPYNLIIAGLISGLALFLAVVSDGMSRSFGALVKVNLERTAMAQDLSELTASLRVRNVQLQKARKQLSEMATVDDLTGLRNRRAVNRSLGIELARSKRSGMPISLVMIDVDHFKLYNDTYGHPAGDEVLRELAEVLLSVTSRAGEMAARLGGEEFLLVLPGSSLNSALSSAELVRERFNGLQIPHRASLTKEFVTISQGVLSCVPNLETTGEQMISAADKALYESKQRGRDVITLSSFAP